MPTTLQLPNKSHQHDYEMMIKEFIDNGDEIVPGQMTPKEWEIFDEFLTRTENYTKGIWLKPGRVPSTLYFIMDKNNKVVGGIAIRHYLNDELRFDAGHIGYGVIPSERKKWYAAMALKLALEKCKEFWIEKVLLTCNKSDIWSAKTIQKNGWVWDSDYEHEWKAKERYRITL